MTQRDKTLVLFLPAGIVILLYVVVYLGGAFKTQLTLSQELETLRAKAPAPEKIQTLRTQALTEQKANTVLQKQLADLDKKWHELAAPCLGPEQRHDRLTSVLGFMSRHRLTLLDHGPDGKDGKAKMQLSAAQETLAKRMAERRPDKKGPQLWRLHLAGTYASVRQALTELGASEASAIAVGLTMEEAPITAGSLREWTLWIWI